MEKGPPRWWVRRNLGGPERWQHLSGLRPETDQPLQGKGSAPAPALPWRRSACAERGGPHYLDDGRCWGNDCHDRGGRRRGRQHGRHRGGSDGGDVRSDGWHRRDGNYGRLRYRRRDVLEGRRRGCGGDGCGCWVLGPCRKERQTVRRKAGFSFAMELMAWEFSPPLFPNPVGVESGQLNGG